jgi:hypothetical protein
MGHRVWLVGLGIALCGLLGGAQTAAASPPSSSSATAGMFVVGDAYAAVGNTVEFWGAQWARDNALSPAAPDAFKGFADIVRPSAPGSCTGTFEARPGDSAAPPAMVTGEIAVLVTGQVTQSGSTISGTYTGLVTVEVRSDYEPNPGHPGTGVVVGSACSTETGGGGEGGSGGGGVAT